MPIELVLLWLVPLALLALLWGMRRWRGEIGPARDWLRRTLAGGDADPSGHHLPAAEAAATTGAPDVPAPSAPAEAPLPAPDAFTLAALRLPITALLLGGLGLIMLGQILYPHLPPEERPRLITLMVLGFAAFLLGTRTIARPRPPRWLLTPSWRLAQALGITGGQLVLLGLAPLYAYLASLAAGPGLSARLPALAWGAWLAAAAAVVGGSLRPGRERPYRFTRNDILLTAGLLALAFLLRGTGTAQIPTTFSGDEGSVGLMAVQFARGEVDNPFVVGWFSFPSLYFWVQGVSVRLFGQTIEAMRIPGALAGAFTVVALYWLARVMFDRTTGLLAAGFLLASHYHIHFSRIGLNNVFDGLFAVVVFVGLWHGWRRGRRASFILAGVALGLGLYFYVTIRVLPLLLLLWAGLAFLARPARFRERLPGMALAAWVALVLFLPLGLYFAAFPREFAAPLNRVTIFEGWLANEVVLTGQSAWTIIRGQMARAALGFTHMPLRLLYDAGTPLLLPGAAALFLLGLFMALWQANLRAALLALPLLSVVVLSGFSQDPPASQRYIVAMPLVAMLVALPLAQIGQWLRRLWPEYRRLIAVGAALVMLALMATDVRYYFGEVYRDYILGGLNTEAATRIAFYLEREPNPTQDVYFLGFPRMGYYSLSTIPYLNPAMNGIDVTDTLTGPPDWPLARDTLFIFLPEREGELAHVRAAYPEGEVDRVYRLRAPDALLFTAYAVDGSALTRP